MSGPPSNERLTETEALVNRDEQLRRVDDALGWKYTGMGRVESAQRLRKIEAAARLVDRCLRDDFSSYDEYDWVEAASKLRSALAAGVSVAGEEPG